MSEKKTILDKPKSNTPELSTIEKLYSETARISWLELQRFFAQGVVMNVADTLNLLDVAVMFAEDSAEELQALVESGQVQAPTNQQAKQWFEREAVLWSVVVAPFVLVQDKPLSELS